MNAKYPVSYQPIHDLQFAGLHLIEASAGTGKTYTLSSLMVRIFLEKYLPSQVIATTFTRAAAAELKSRIRSRLVEMLEYLEPLRCVLEKDIQALSAQETDPLKQQVLQTFAPRIAYACERLKLVIDQLDELFVGTLDSFSQKLLREFAFESGKIERANITDDAKSYTRQLIHDVLREWIQSQPQLVIDALYTVGGLKGVDHFVSMVESSLNFSSAQFKLPDMPEIELAQRQQWQQQAQQIDLSTLTEYFHLEGAYYQHINGTSFRNHAFHQLFTIHCPAVLNALKQPENIQIFDAHFEADREAVFKFLEKLENQKIFKKCPAEIADGFYQHPVLLQLQTLCRSLQQTQQKFEQLQVYLKAYLCIEVKKRLPQVLQQKGETTFAQQIKTLSDALKGEQGQRFAVFVQARYPLILVDEFQDTNQDQDDMLASIWRHPQRYQKGCMIMVGDRKQAIYGFRGGDMLTFLNAYQDIRAKQGREYKLIHNHRSVKELVEVVDVLFQRQIDFGEHVVYDPIQAGSRPHPALIENQQSNPTPLRWLQLEEGNEQATQVAWKIQSLLNQAQSKQLYLDDGGLQKAICEDDIAVLSRSHRQLDEVQYVLERLGIRVNRPSKRSVFDSVIAKDVGALLTAILHPYDEAKLKRALLSRLFGFDLTRLLALQQSAEGLSLYIQRLDDIREMWLTQGFLAAWQACLNQFGIWQQLVATQSKDNERAVVNLRHLTDILSQHSEHIQGIQNLYHWYLKQLHSPGDREWELEQKLSSEAGVQLITIHQSKGLEYKIVFLLGANKAFSDTNNSLNFSTTDVQLSETGQTRTQRVVSVADKNFLQATEIEQHQQRALAEQNRLWYVALTRASHRVYAVFEPEKGDKNKFSGLAFWKNQGDAFQHPYSADERIILERPQTLQAQQAQPPILLAAQALPTQRFYARAKTSFSYLAQHLKYKANHSDHLANIASNFEQAEDETIASYPLETSRDSNLGPMVQLQPIAWIKQYFPKGTLAGNFLHEIFEQINFQCPDMWVEEIRRRFKNSYQGLWDELLECYQQQFPQQAYAEQQLYQWIADWLGEVLSTPLNQGFQLRQLATGHYLSECPFYLALSDRVLAMKRVQQLFEEYEIHMPDLLEAKSARYLNGSIDLMYFDGQRYHIADYKSNYLGATQADYQHAQIIENMSFSSYWLQAALYLVALHRYLCVKLQDYQIEQHLGGASYLYLRGMNGQAQHGHLYWKPEDEFILRLDAILGYFSEDNAGKMV